MPGRGAPAGEAGQRGGVGASGSGTGRSAARGGRQGLRLTALAGGVALAVAALGLAAALVQAGWLSLALPLAGVVVGPPRPSAGPYEQQVAALLERHDAAVALADALLAERDASPTLVQDAAWLERHARVTAELEAEHAALQALRPPPELVGVHECLSEALRLTSTGQSLLHRSFLTGGHGAYYLSSHGNWDLHLGSDKMRECRSALSAGP